ncbi:MAG: AAC(3) family N-acetyltransferase [Spirochaetales bacterium]|nr:AAC(3) family N-acetyltransferase [Spirochaetales bacterium]
MYTKSDLLRHIEEIGIRPEDTLLIHSSMKAIGEVENRADGVLDAFIEYMKPGLLVFPTHTWEQMNNEYTLFNPLTEPSCVGILTNLFLKRPGVVRSWNPTHSVAALGADALSFVAGEEQWDNPCDRRGCWGKLYDRKAKILFLGCTFSSNTIIHGVEAWNDIPFRLTEDFQPLRILTPDGRILERPLRRHDSPYGDVSKHYTKLEAPMLATEIARKGKIGDAQSIFCDAHSMVDLTSTFLHWNPDLFIDDLPVPGEWYESFKKKPV